MLPAEKPDANLLMDVDLSILGQPERRFQQFEAQIRQEYDWGPAEIFAQKRAKILERFLGREKIYSTGRFFDKYEQQARANLQVAIRKLKG